MDVDPNQMGQSAFQRSLMQDLRQNHPVAVKGGNLEGESTKSDKKWVIDYPYTHQKNLEALQEDMEIEVKSVIKRELRDIEKFVLHNRDNINLLKHFQTANFSIRITPSIVHWALQNKVGGK
jgi:hypothetical protein